MLLELVITLILLLLVGAKLCERKIIPVWLLVALITINVCWILGWLVNYIWANSLTKGFFWFWVIGTGVATIGAAVASVGGGGSKTVITHGSDERVTKVRIEKKR